MTPSSAKSRVRICTHITCCQRGSQRIATALTEAFRGTDTEVTTTENCFRFCKSGPNVAVNGALLHHMNPGNAATKVRAALTTKTRKKEAIGMRSLDELDDALEEMMRL